MEQNRKDNDKLFQELVIAIDAYNITVIEQDKFTAVRHFQLDRLIEKNKAYRSVFLKLKPIFESFGGQTDIMSALPTLMPLVQGLGKDEELKNDLATILSNL